MVVFSTFNKLREELLHIPDTFTAEARAITSNADNPDTTRPRIPRTLNIYISSPEGLRRRVLDIAPKPEANHLASNKLLHDQMEELRNWKEAQGLDLVSEGTTITQSQALAKIWTRERIETYVNEAVEEVLSRLTNAFKVGDVNGTTDRNAV